VVIGQFIFISTYVIKVRKEIKNEIKKTWKYALGVGILNPTAYIIVLVVMTFVQVSYVAPIREISILIGTIMGAVLLSEKGGRERIIGASLMTIGVFLIALN